MDSRSKPWSERKIKQKPCRICNRLFNPVSGGNFYCPVCVVEHKRQQHAKGQQAWRKKNPQQHALYKANNDLKRFNMTMTDYESMLLSQNNSCAICKTNDPKGRGKTRKFSVDHCHSTGKVRALLCHRCNGALGMVSDNVETLKTMISYLEHYRNA